MPSDANGMPTSGKEPAAYDARTSGFDVVSHDDYASSFDEAREAGFDIIPQAERLFISYDAWMQRTHLTFGMRNAELRRLDEAILRAEQIGLDIVCMDDELDLLFQRGYPICRSDEVKAAMTKEAYQVVHAAFQAWVKSEGDWRNSRRNNQLAASQVYQELREFQQKYGNPVHDAEMKAAKSYLDRMLEKQAAELFRGARVQFRGADLSNSLQVSGQSSAVYGMAKDVKEIFQGCTRLFESIFGESQSTMATQDPAFAQEIAKLVPSLACKIHDFCKLLPVIGIATTTISALNASYNVYSTDQNRTKLLRVAEAIPVADARAALGAIKSWQDRYIQEQRNSAVTEASMAGLQLLATLVPVTQPIATVLGAAKSLATAMTTVVNLRDQYFEKRRLAAYLYRTEGIGLEIFSLSPLVGAYYALNSSLATFSLHLCPYDSPTFQADTEYLRESGEMKAILCDAAQIIDLSRWVLTKNGLQFRTKESDSWLRTKTRRMEVKARFKAQEVEAQARLKAQEVADWARQKAIQLKSRWAS